ILSAAAAPSPAQDLASAVNPLDARIRAARTMAPDAAKTSAGAPGRLMARVLIKQGSLWLPVPYLAFHAVIAGRPALVAADGEGTAVIDGCQGAEKVSAYADLNEADFSIRPLLAGRVELEGACGQALELDFDRGNPSAAALRVWRVATKARVKLAGIGPSAWPRGVVFHVNADGATSGTNVGVGPDATTFVAGHELGHAISNA